MTHEQAIQRVEEIISSGQAFVMATVDADGRPHMRWMGAVARDPHDRRVGYLISSSQANKMRHLAANPATQLLFTTPKYETIVILDGESEAVTDQVTRKMVWDAIPAAADYFSGPDSEEYGVIRFTACCLEVRGTRESTGPVRIEL